LPVPHGLWGQEKELKAYIKCTYEVPEKKAYKTGTYLMRGPKQSEESSRKNSSVIRSRSNSIQKSGSPTRDKKDEKGVKNKVEHVCVFNEEFLIPISKPVIKNRLVLSVY
jgi:hypothetical protein